MALFTCEDPPNEAVTISAKEIINANRMAAPKDNNHHEFSPTLYRDGEANGSIITTESSAEMYHFTTESDIDKTAELLPSGKIKSHQNGIKTAVNETLPPSLTSSVFQPKICSPSLINSQEKHFHQPSKTESTKTLVRQGLELSEGALDFGKTEALDNVTTDLYSDGTYGTYLTRPDSVEILKQFVNLKTKSDDDDEDEDLYTDSDLYRGIDISDIRSKTDMLYMNKVWYRPSPEKLRRKMAVIKFDSSNDYLMGSTEKDDKETDDGEAYGDTFMIQSTEHESQTKRPFGLHASTSPEVPYDSTLHESNLTDDLKLKHSLKILHDNETKDPCQITVKHNTDQTQNMADWVSKEVKQCEGEASNENRQKDAIYHETVNDRNGQLGNTNMLFDQNTNSKAPDDDISATPSVRPLNIDNVLSSQATFLSLESKSNESMDNCPQSSSKTTSYDGESQPSTQLGIPACASQEDKPSLKDIENTPQICLNNVAIDSIESNGDNNTTRMRDCKAVDSVTDAEFQRKKDLSTICPKKEDTRQSSPMINVLSSNHISPEHDLTSTDSNTINGGSQMDSSSKSFNEDSNNVGIKTWVDEHHAKYEPIERHVEAYCEVMDQQDQVPTNTINTNKHYSKDDTNIIEIRKKPCNSHDKNSETANHNELPEKEDTSGSVTETETKKDDNEAITSSKSNKSLQSIELQTSNISSDPSINSSKLADKPTDTLSNSVLTTRVSYPSYYFKTASTDQSDSSHPNLKSFAEESFQRTTSSPASFYQCQTTTSADTHDQCQTTFPDSMSQSESNSSDLLYESKITSDNSPNKSTVTISDSTNHCTFNPINISHQDGTMNQDFCLSGMTFVDLDLTHETTHASDSSILRSKTSSDSSDECKTTTQDSFYHGNTSSPNTHDQCSSTIVDSAFQCTVTCLNLSDQCTTCSTNQSKNNSPDSPHHYEISPTDPSQQCRIILEESSIQIRNTCLDPSGQCISISDSSTYQGRQNSSDSSACTKISLDPSDHGKTTTLGSFYQGTTNSLDTSDLFMTTYPEVTNQCRNSLSDPFMNDNSNAPDPFQHVTPSTLHSTYQWKNDLSEMSYSSDSSTSCTMTSYLSTSDHSTTSFPDPASQGKDKPPDLSHQSIVTSSDLNNQCPSVTPSLPSKVWDDQYTTTFPDVTYRWSNDSLNLYNQCESNNSVSSSKQATDTFLEPRGQCTTTIPDPNFLFNISPNSFHQDTMTSLDRYDQDIAISIKSHDECSTISSDSSNLIKHHTSSQTSQDFIISSSDSSDPESYDSTDRSCQTPSLDVSNDCIKNTQNLPSLFKINSDQPLKISNYTTDVTYSCREGPSDPMQDAKTASSNHSNDENMVTRHGSSYPCTSDFFNGLYQFTNTSPSQHDQCMDNTIDPNNQCTTCTAHSSHHYISTTPNTSCHSITYPNYHTMLNCGTHNPCTNTSPNSPQESLTSPDLCLSTTNPEPSNQSTIFGDPQIPCTTISLIPNYQKTSSTESLDQFSICAESLDQFTSSLDLSCDSIDLEPLKEPTQDEYGGLIKQKECTFLGEMRKIYLDNQELGVSLLDSGVMLTRRVNYLENIALMELRDGRELATVVRGSKLFLYYKLDKHFYVTVQLSEDWYQTQDCITKVTMLMKKVPLTSNWLKILHNFLCLPHDRRLLIPYAVVTDRNGSILFLMEDRNVIGIGTPPPVYMINTMKNLSTVLHFMKYCWTHRVLPGKIAASTLYTLQMSSGSFTDQGICFDPSGLCNNEDLCEFNKCLRKYLQVFLFNGQQEESDGIVELLLERAQLLMEEDWPPQVCLARLLSSTQGALPFSIPSL